MSDPQNEAKGDTGDHQGWGFAELLESGLHQQQLGQAAQSGMTGERSRLARCTQPSRQCSLFIEHLLCMQQAAGSGSKMLDPFLTRKDPMGLNMDSVPKVQVLKAGDSGWQHWGEGTVRPLRVGPVGVHPQRASQAWQVSLLAGYSLL